ncbi:MAG: hypothetical protein AAFV37_01065 [Pseudomonadota bacterium]
MSLDGLTLNKRFALVALMHLLMDVCLTLLLIHRGIDVFTARALAIALSLMVSWRINRALLLMTDSAAPARDDIQYAPIIVVLAVVNFGLYALMLFGVSVLSAIVLASGLVTSIALWGNNRLQTSLVV